ncbi:MAG: hypothetical protein IPQ06_10810 [Chitinophagaceae bacterium]|nr:hypothetical protein [Chitinophagaceae bacterium]
MEKINRRHLEFLVLLCMICSTAFTQAKSGLQNYTLLSQENEYLWMPVFHYQARNGVYAELRYNYEDVQTLSFYGGKTFSGGKTLQFSLTPMLGYSTGRFTGLSLATNVEVEWKNFYLSSQTQYSMATKQNSADFFFSWSELGYDISDNFFAGVAIQYTRQQEMNDTEPGVMAGLNFKNISIPFYVFGPFKSGRYFVLGLNYECDFKKKR